MTRPHEETWTATPMLAKREPRWGIKIDEDNVVIGLCAETHSIQSAVDLAAEKMPARAQLAAQAPSLVRLLLKLEWAGEDGCPVCGEPEYTTEQDDSTATLHPDGKVRYRGKRVPSGHEPECELAAALRAAGVPPEARLGEDRVKPSVKNSAKGRAR